MSSKKIQSLSGNLKESSDGISVSLKQLHSTGAELAQLSTQAAASVEETAASLEEISSMVKQNTSNAQAAADLSVRSAELARTGEVEMTKLIAVMGEIGTSSKRIEEIIAIIDDIAFQTNLLALNASVEAARAGEHGRGFAVVADAVRSLAQRSATAAKDIGTLILTSVEQVKQGTVTAQENGEFLKKISESVNKVSQLNTEIAQASVEQATGITSTTTSIGEIDQLVQRNAAQAEEIVDIAKEIETKSHVMDSTVKTLSGDS
jgi:methyl-accepting chemotaxis protein